VSDSRYKRVFVQSFGCRASQADGAALETAFQGKGVETVRSAADADLVVLNTCTVTSTADGDARHAVRKVLHENPSARILVTGCYAQRSPQELAALPGVTWVVGNSHKIQIPDIVLDVAERAEPYHGQIVASDMAASREFLASPILDAYGDRSRPILKVQDGCSNKCSFCIIPSVRGRSRSAPLGDVVHQVRQLSERYAEVVLSGINLGRWGRDLTGNLRFSDLVRTLLAETSVRRLRISSVEPMDWTSDLLELMAAEPRIAQHVHIPLQSGCDAVLKRMYRKYRVRHYESRLALARALMPHAAIGADVMTGFPGETDEEFEESRRFIASQPFTYLHVFTYSERPGTAAAEETSQVPVVKRRERTRLLRQLSEEKNLEFRRSMVGRSLSAVTLGGDKGLTSNYLPLRFCHPRDANQIVDVRVGSVAADGLRELELFRVLPAS
jgi:threonylcarbamoyladenosine tRNA methylthiotransferase MtaB